MLTADRLRQILEYDPGTGIFRWKFDPAKKPNINSRDIRRAAAGSLRGSGRRVIKIAGRPYYCSRLAWLYIHGEWPDPEADHENGIKNDDRINNLRVSTRSQNQHNVGITNRNTSGRKGVHWNKRYQKWQAEIVVAGRKQYLGRYDDLDLAAEAYRTAARLHHGDFARTE